MIQGPALLGCFLPPTQSCATRRRRIAWKRHDVVTRESSPKYSRRSSSGSLTAARRIPLWLAESGGLGRRPSIIRRNLGTPSWLSPCRPRAQSRAPSPDRRANRIVPNGVDPGSAPIGALVIHDFLEHSRCIHALMQAQVSEAAQTNRIEVRALVWRGGCQQFHALRRLVAVEGDRRANLGSLHGIPDGSVWKNLRSLRGELLRLGCIAAHRQRQGRTPQAARGLAIARQRVGTRIGFVEFGGDVPESPAQRCLRGPLVQFVRLTTLAIGIPV